MHYVAHTPDTPPLAGVVELMFHLAGYTPAHRIERLIPDGRIALIIELDGKPRHIYDRETGEPTQVFCDAWISGIHRQYLSFGEVTNTELIAVLFPPGTAYALMHRPLSTLNDRVLSAVDVFGPEVLALRTCVRDTAGSAEKLRYVETWLIERYDPARESDALVAAAVAAIAADPTVTTVRDLVARIGVSRKHLATLFSRHVGPSPKMLQRILRFAAAVQRIQQAQTVDWAALSTDCGYFDQSHFIRDFRAFSGYKPKQFVDAGFDRPNFFPED